MHLSMRPQERWVAVLRALQWIRTITAGSRWVVVWAAGLEEGVQVPRPCEQETSSVRRCGRDVVGCVASDQQPSQAGQGAGALMTSMLK